jgi:hypothetical protein
MKAALLPLFILLAGCAHQQAAVPPGAAPPAATSVSGVRLEIDAEQPMEEGLTQLRLTIENGTGIPIRLRYDQLALFAAGGLKLPVLPPLSGAGASFHDLTAQFEQAGLFLPLQSAPVFPQLPIWTGPFQPRSEDEAAWREGLPSEQMVSRAVPECVLEKGGRVSGLVFFDALPEGLDRAILEVQLVAAESGEPFAMVDIPFRLAPPPKH